MIILYEENEVKFESLGLGVLKDALSAIVKESLNDSFEFEIEYPITGALYNELKVNRIITSKSSPYSDPQPFRITNISKPISGIVTISMVHISYDMNGIIVGPINGSDLKNTLQLLENGSILEQNFKFFAEDQVLKSFTTTNYYNMRSLLFGSSESILETYKQEIKFNKFDVYLMPMRGSNKGAEIRYGKNMTDLTHEISYENLYNGVYPYYHKETSNATTRTTNDDFTEVYIVNNSIPLADGWLSYSNGGEPYHPINESPVKINSQGDYYGKVFTWDTTKQKYIERLVDQTITIVEGVTSPEWIYIDWTKLPTITVKANKAGYFKMGTETEYQYYNSGDIVWQGSIRSVLSNLIVYYSEVIPQSTSDYDDPASEVKHVDLTDKILYLDTDTAKKMKFNRILSLDLTSEFEDDEEPNDETLKEKALKYIRENKIGEYKYNTKVSFIDLSSTTEGIEYKGFDKIELGDTVKISYEALDVDLELRVISIEYDALLDVYSNIELGEKSDNISSSSVQTGDSISSLSNDKGYQTQQEVVKIVADTITAEYIQAKNATLSKAQIEQLETARIRCTGIIEASQFDLDHLVAKFLTADNAEIKGVLKSGEIEVSGDITITSGEISIQNESRTKTFSVDRDGNLYANSATIEGTITASNGNIGGFTIGTNAIYNNLPDMESDNENGVYVGIDGISLGKQLKIYPDGTITSLVNNSSVDPSSPEALFNKQRSAKRTVDLRNEEIVQYNYIGTKNVTTILPASNYNTYSVINMASDGIFTNEDSSVLELSKGDNIYVCYDPENDNVFWKKLENGKFDFCYKYIGELKTSQIYDDYTNNKFTNGDIVKILEKDEETDHFSGFEVGDYIAMNIGSEDTIYDFGTYTPSSSPYHPVIWSWTNLPLPPSLGGGYAHELSLPNVTNITEANITSAILRITPGGIGDPITLSYAIVNGRVKVSFNSEYEDPYNGGSARFASITITGTYKNGTTHPTYTWNKFYYANSADSFFGLTPDGILYANGAVISGDITVKSGEISIENETGEKVFRVTRDGDMTANSGEIGGFTLTDSAFSSGPASDRIIKITSESVSLNPENDQASIIMQNAILHKGFLGPSSKGKLSIGHDGVTQMNTDFYFSMYIDDTDKRLRVYRSGGIGPNGRPTGTPQIYGSLPTDAIMRIPYIDGFMDGTDDLAHLLDNQMFVRNPAIRIVPLTTTMRNTGFEETFVIIPFIYSNGKYIIYYLSVDIETRTTTSGVKRIYAALSSSQSFSRCSALIIGIPASDYQGNWYN